MTTRKERTMQFLEELAVSTGLTFQSTKDDLRFFNAEVLNKGRDFHVWKLDDTLVHVLTPQPSGDLSVLTLHGSTEKTELILGRNQQSQCRVTILSRRTIGGYDPSSIGHREYELMLARLEGSGKYHPPRDYAI